MSYLSKIYKCLPFKKPLFSLLKRFCIPSFYRKLYFIGKFKIKVNKTCFRMFHYGYLIENEIFWKGINNGWEPGSVAIWSKLCEFSDSIVDIGANTGIFSLVAGAINPKASIFAFEPVKRTYDKLKYNVELNRFNIKCFDKAISNYDGRGIIYDSLKSNILSVTVNRNLYPDNNFYPVEIETIQLDTFISNENLTKIDLIKIDVETHEVEVLEGFKFFLMKFQPTILIEVLTEEIAQKLNEIFQGKDYYYFNIDESKGLVRVDQIIKCDGFNYLLCKKGTAIKLELI